MGSLLSSFHAIGFTLSKAFFASHYFAFLLPLYVVGSVMAVGDERKKVRHNLSHGYVKGVTVEGKREGHALGLPHLTPQSTARTWLAFFLGCCLVNMQLLVCGSEGLPADRSICPFNLCSLFFPFQRAFSAQTLLKKTLIALPTNSLNFLTPSQNLKVPQA